MAESGALGRSKEGRWRSLVRWVRPNAGDPARSTSPTRQPASTFLDDN